MRRLGAGAYDPCHTLRAAASRRDAAQVCAVRSRVGRPDPRPAGLARQGASAVLMSSPSQALSTTSSVRSAPRSTGPASAFCSPSPS
jgi:hypothetical protein